MAATWESVQAPRRSADRMDVFTPGAVADKTDTFTLGARTDRQIGGNMFTPGATKDRRVHIYTGCPDR